MRLYTAVLIVGVLILSGLTGAAAAPSGGQGNGGDSGSASGFIVVLDSGDPNDVAAEHSQRHNAEVSHVYTTALRGYAAQMSEQAADRVARDDRVAYVDRDGEVEALHHQCGHSGGPPGSGEGECSDSDTGAVHGTVTADDTGEGIDGATVTLDGETDYTATTGSNGGYEITEVATGDYTATADADGYEAQSQPVTVTADTTTTADFSLTAAPEDGSQSVPWGVDRVGAPSAHDAGRTGGDPSSDEGVRIYVIDTGIDAEHSDLNVDGGHAVEECKGGDCSADYDDDHGHGTHVAGTAAALDDNADVLGVAPDARLYAVKVLSKNGRGTRSGVIAGIDWVTTETKTHGQPTVANMSLGGSGEKTAICTESGLSDGTDSYHEAICNAKNAGVVFSVAAGNSGADAQDSVPAAYDDAVITVSATTEGDDWPSWSNWGDNSAGWTDNDSAPVALAAPGADILSTRLGGGTTTKSGTSMAAPHVAGAAALFLDANPQSAGHSAFANTRSSLLSTAESTDGFSNTSGNPHAEDFLSVN